MGMSNVKVGLSFMLKGLEDLKQDWYFIMKCCLGWSPILARAEFVDPKSYVLEPFRSQINLTQKWACFVGSENATVAH